MVVESRPPAAPLPTRPKVSATIAAQINAAARDHHTHLNHLITHRLPLALPPHTSTPHAYTAGFAAFADIYTTFERAWRTVLATRDPEHVQERASRNNTSHDRDVLDFLERLMPVGLWRAQRAQEDLRVLRRRCACLCEKCSAVGMVTHEPASCERDSGALLASKMVDLREAYIRRYPHVLIAYAWVMYMAVFSGGRWIRQQLWDTGHGFWEGLGSTGDVAVGDEGRGREAGDDNESGLSFWSFSGCHDGEDIKADFKARLEGADALLTSRERVEVVQEAEWIFKHCIALVSELDGLFQQQPASLSPALLGTRIRGRGRRLLFILLLSLWVVLSFCMYGVLTGAWIWQTPLL